MKYNKRLRCVLGIGAVYLLSGCGSVPPKNQVSIGATTPLVQVHMPDLVLGRGGKNDTDLDPATKPAEFRELGSLRSFCVPGALSQYGDRFLDTAEIQEFDDAMRRGGSIAERRYYWNFEAKRVKKQGDLLHAFLNGRASQVLTPEKFSQLRLQEEAYQTAYQNWQAKLAEAQRASKTGFLSPEQIRNLPRFSSPIMRTAFHQLPAVVDGIKHNNAVLEAQDKLLREQELVYGKELEIIYEKALKKQLSMPPSVVSLEQMASFDTFRSYSIYACMGRVLPANRSDAKLESIDPQYKAYIKAVVRPKLEGAYANLGSIGSSAALEAEFSKKFSTLNLASVAMEDTEFNRKYSALSAELKRREEAQIAEKNRREAALLADKRRKEAAAIAAERQREINAYRQKAAKGVLPTKDELLDYWINLTVENTNRRRGNFLVRYVREGDLTISSYLTLFSNSIRNFSMTYDVSGFLCSAASGKVQCSWIEKINYRKLGIIADDVYDDTIQRSHSFAWTDSGLKCIDECDPRIISVSEYGGASGGGSYGGGRSGDLDDMHQQSNDMQRARDDARRERQERWQADQEERRERSRGRCKSTDICPFY